MAIPVPPCIRPSGPCTLKIGGESALTGDSYEFLMIMIRPQVLDGPWLSGYKDTSVALDRRDLLDEEIVYSIRGSRTVDLARITMARFTLGANEYGEELRSDFQEFVEVAKGRSIVSAADWGKDRFELGLSGDLMIPVFLSGDTIDVNLISTTNPGEIPPIAITLGNLSQRVPIHVVEDKLNGLRTLHAIFYLMQNERASDLAAYLTSEPEGDIERALLADEDRLYIESISYGSWLLTVWAKTKSAYKSLSSVAGLVFERGKDAYLRKLERVMKYTAAMLQPYGA